MTPGIGASDLRAGRAVGPGQLSGRPWAVRVNCRTLLALAVISFLVVACDGQPAAAPTPRPGTPSPLPASRTPAAPSAVRAAVYQARTSTIPTAMRRRMIGASWHPGCPLGLDQLRLLTLSYWGFDHAVHQGQLIVNESAARALTGAFRLLFAARYPIRQMRVVDVFGGSDERSMLADNTSAFNCRRVRGTTSWSEHSYGLAVDINPFENPEVVNGAIDPPAAAAWADRSRHTPAMIRHGDAVWRAFISVGWKWGGDWTSPKDYQHFPPTAGDGQPRHDMPLCGWLRSHSLAALGHTGERPGRRPQNLRRGAGQWHQLCSRSTSPARRAMSTLTPPTPRGSQNGSMTSPACGSRTQPPA